MAFRDFDAPALDGTQRPVGLAIVEDRVHLVGAFAPTIDLGGGPLHTNGVQIQMFLAALTLDGEHVWSRAFAGGYRGGISVAPAPAGTYVAGEVVYDTEFGPQPQQAPWYRHAFVAGIDGTGQKTWSKLVEDPFDQGVVSAASDAMGRIHLAGDFLGSIDLGCGTHAASASGPYYVRAGFLAQLEPDGACSWSKMLKGSLQANMASVHAGADGLVRVTGTFSGSIDLGGGPLSPGGVFVAAYGGGGEPVWGLRTGNVSVQVHDIAALPDGGAVLVGRFNGYATLGSELLTSEPCSEDVVPGTKGTYQCSDGFVALVGP